MLYNYSYDLYSGEDIEPKEPKEYEEEEDDDDG
jgi:hypothetical protein